MKTAYEWLDSFNDTELRLLVKHNASKSKLDLRRECKELSSVLYRLDWSQRPKALEDTDISSKEFFEELYRLSCIYKTSIRSFTISRVIESLSDHFPAFKEAPSKVKPQKTEKSKPYKRLLL
jgi:hypothetical protein